jgi:hypothetical protein
VDLEWHHERSVNVEGISFNKFNFL